MIDQKKYIHFIEMYRKTYSDQKEKGMEKWAGNVPKSAKRSVRRDYQ